MGGLYVNEPATREILLFLARHYVEGFRKRDKDIISLLSNVVFYFIPYFEQNDYYEKKCVTDDQANLTGPLLIATNQPNGRKVTNSLWRMLQQEQFDMMFSLEGGSMSIKLVYLVTVELLTLKIICNNSNILKLFLVVQQFIQKTQFPQYFGIT